MALEIKRRFLSPYVQSIMNQYYVSDIALSPPLLWSRSEFTYCLDYNKEHLICFFVILFIFLSKCYCSPCWNGRAVHITISHDQWVPEVMHQTYWCGKIDTCLTYDTCLSGILTFRPCISIIIISDACQSTKFHAFCGLVAHVFQNVHVGLRHVHVCI